MINPTACTPVEAHRSYKQSKRIPGGRARKSNPPSVSEGAVESFNKGNAVWNKLGDKPMLMQQYELSLHRCDLLCENPHDAGNADPRSMGKPQRLMTRKRNPKRKRNQVI